MDSGYSNCVKQHQKQQKIPRLFTHFSSCFWDFFVSVSLSRGNSSPKSVVIGTRTAMQCNASCCGQNIARLFCSVHFHVLFTQLGNLRGPKEVLLHKACPL